MTEWSLVPLGLDNVNLLPQPCRSCIRWEVGPERSGKVATAGQAEFEKEVWLSGVMLSWGSCGQLVMVDDDVAGFATFAPPTAVDTVMQFPTAPVSPDAVLLLTSRILPSYRGRGLARYLLQGVAKHLAGRGVRAIEVFAHRGEATSLPSDEAIPPCLIPADFALSVGFTEVRAHHRYPRLRLELDAALGWKASVEAALEQLFTVIRMPAGPNPSLTTERTPSLTPVGQVPPH
jgi:GNAT superfamily N-acetyltransferase